MPSIASSAQAVCASRIRELAEIALRMNGVYKLYFGESNVPTPDFIKRAAAKALNDGYTFYTSNAGIPTLREALAAYYRRMHDVLKHPAVRRVIDEAMDQRNERGIRTPMDLLREVQAIDAAAGGAFVAAVSRFRPSLVVNEVRTADEIKLGFAVRSVCRKYFGIDAEYLGYVNHDDDARRSVLARRPLVELTPGSDAAVYLERIARKLADPARLTGLANDPSA